MVVFTVALTHRARDPLHAHHRAQALRVRHAGQDRHHARVPGRLEARRRALLPHQRRQERGPLQSVRGAGGAGGQRYLRRSLGRLQVLRHGQGHRRSLRSRPQRARRGADGGVETKVH